MAIVITISADDVNKGILAFYLAVDGSGVHAVKRYAQGDLLNGVREKSIDMSLNEIVGCRL